MNWELSEKIQLSSLALGIVGEFGEVAEIMTTIAETEEEVTQIKDEIGDVFWYVANLCTYIDMDWRVLFSQKSKRLTLGSASNKGFIAAAKVADAIKKISAQGHDLEDNKDKIVNHLKTFMLHVVSIIIYYGLNPQEVCAYNHGKLLKRYPNGFEAVKSVNREV
jgi:NTP pyrophosphatase (non-canonical NTP hydrolase)